VLLAANAASIEEALVALLLIAAAVAILARRAGVPYTIGLVLVGLAVGLVTHVSAVSLSSDLVFYVFLPVLLFEAAFALEARHLISDWRRVLVLAVPGVLVAFALTAVGVHLAGGMAWGAALLFGALISATDPVSVTALFRRLGVPSRLTTLVDAESLFNDGTAAVLFAIVTAAVWPAVASSSASRSGTPLPGCSISSTSTSSRSPSRPSRRSARSCWASSWACPAWWPAWPPASCWAASAVAGP
jgi:NhaP-type Na+/H+ or K+/H+ antiporter